MKLTLKTHGGQATGRAGNLPAEELASASNPRRMTRQATLKTRRKARRAGKRRRATLKLTVHDLDAFKAQHREEPLELLSTHGPAARQNSSVGPEKALVMPSSYLQPDATPRGKRR